MNKITVKSLTFPSIVEKKCDFDVHIYIISILIDYGNSQIICRNKYYHLEMKNSEKNEQDPSSIFRQHFNNPTNADLALLLISNNEMDVDGLAKCLGVIRNKNLLEGRQFNFEGIRLESNPYKGLNIGQEQELESRQNFVKNYKQDLQERLSKLDAQNINKHFLYTGIQQISSSLLFELKQKNLSNGEQREESEPKTVYLKELMKNIIDISSREQPDDEVLDNIIQAGSVEVAYADPLFANDTNFRKRFRTILTCCKTFNELRDHAGEDIHLIKDVITKNISQCLISLKFQQDISKEILKDLLENPLSNIVAATEKLSNKHKRSYYTSQFYTNGELKNYAQILKHRDSLGYQLKEDIVRILGIIDEHHKISKQLLKHILNFNVYELLKCNAISSQKKTIFDVIYNQCPNYLKAFKKYKDHKKDDFFKTLKENPKIFRKFQLVETFLKIELPFEQWEMAEERILAQKYSAIDELYLNLEGKNKLIQHIIDKVEPSFHNEAVNCSYRSKIEILLIKKFMETEISHQLFERIFRIVTQCLDSNDFRSDFAKNLVEIDKQSYQEILKIEEFQKYKANNRKDMHEEKYKEEWKLKQKIYEDNFNDEISVTYGAIDKLVKQVIENGGKFPSKYPKYVANLAKFNLQVAQSQSEISLNQNPLGLNIKPFPIVEPAQSQEELNAKLAELIKKFVDTYIQTHQQSLFQRILNEKFGKNSFELMNKVIETEAFTNPDSPFYSNLGFNSLILKKIKKQFADNAELASIPLRECSEILKKLKKGDSPQKVPPLLLLEPAFNSPLQKSPNSESHRECQSPIPIKSKQTSPNKNDSPSIKQNIIEEDYRSEINSFAENYLKNNEQSYFEKVRNEKFGKDSVKLVKSIIDSKAYENPSSPFFEALGYNNIILKKIKTEFSKLGPNLKRCIELSALLQ